MQAELTLTFSDKLTLGDDKPQVVKSDYKMQLGMDVPRAVFRAQLTLMLTQNLGHIYQTAIGELDAKLAELGKAWEEEQAKKAKAKAKAKKEKEGETPPVKPVVKPAEKAAPKT
jgi:hypothetical protein